MPGTTQAGQRNQTVAVVAGIAARPSGLLAQEEAGGEHPYAKGQNEFAVAQWHGDPSPAMAGPKCSQHERLSLPGQRRCSGYSKN